MLLIKIISGLLMIPTKHEMSKKWPLKAKTHSQNTQPIHQSDGDTPKNPPVEEQREKMDRNEENDEEQIDGAGNNSDGTTHTQDDNVMVEEVVTAIDQQARILIMMMISMKMRTIWLIL